MRALLSVPLILLLATARIPTTEASTPAPEPAAKVLTQADIHACDCDLCGPKGFGSPPDGKVNVHDLLKFMVTMQNHDASLPTSKKADFNLDGAVDMKDLLIFFNRFGKDCPENAKHYEANDICKWFSKLDYAISSTIRKRSTAQNGDPAAVGADWGSDL